MDPTELIEEINAVAASPQGLDSATKADLLAACDTLKRSIEGPIEATLRVLTAPHQAVALRLAVAIRLFDAAASFTSAGGAVSVEQLASQADADPLLVARIMRILAGLHIFEETSASTYTATPLASVYREGSPIAAAVVHMTSQARFVMDLPSYFEGNGYTSPNDAYKALFQHTMHTELHYFDWLARQPRLQEVFDSVQASWRAQRGLSWSDVFPVADRLSSSSPDTSGAPLLVDVGGGSGQNLIALKKGYPDVRGKLVVQDLPVVVNGVKDLPPGIEAVAHNFFTPQPVQSQNAQFYFLGNVLHDWPDKQAGQILRHLHRALLTSDNTSGDSSGSRRLLIWENILPEQNVPPLSAALDLTMLANFSSLKRTLAQYRTLLDKAGFELVKTWTREGGEPAEGGQRLLEAAVKSEAEAA